MEGEAPGPREHDLTAHPDLERIAMTLVYLDTETTGLDATIHDVVEVAWAVDEGPIRTAVLPHTLRNADPKALEINGYWERDLDDARLLGGTAARTGVRADVRDLLRDLRGATLVGSNPAFDARFLRAKFGLEHWHHRLLDVGTYAAGVLGWDLPRGLKDVRDRLVEQGWTIPDPDHTAFGDVATVRACHIALQLVREDMGARP